MAEVKRYDTNELCEDEGCPRFGIDHVCNPRKVAIVTNAQGHREIERILQQLKDAYTKIAALERRLRLVERALSYFDKSEAALKIAEREIDAEQKELLK